MTASDDVGETSAGVEGCVGEHTYLTVQIPARGSSSCHVDPSCRYQLDVIWVQG